MGKMKEKKKIDFILETKDFMKNSDVSQKTIQNVIDSFRNFLKMLDKKELKDKDKNGNIWTIENLEKIENKIIKNINSAIKGECCLIDEKGKLSNFNSTEKIIMNIIDNVNKIILTRKKIKELKEVKK